MMMTIAKGDPLPKLDRRNATSARKLREYGPIFRHPLPMSEDWAQFQAVLKRVLSCKLDDQVLAAITLENAWVLEEVYMRGAPPYIADVNGFAPIHIAAQRNAYECIMVLLNIGVDINVATLSGMTPLYMAHAAGATQAFQLLSEHKAKMISDAQLKLQGATVLDPAANPRRSYDDHF